jgi:omega-6 fatty acid desaturase (delta-12 desaturase)
MWALYKSATFVDTMRPPEGTVTLGLAYLLWTVHGFLAGLIAVGLWDVGHECGHHAFSDVKAVNDIVGWIIHSA